MAENPYPQRSLRQEFRAHRAQVRQVTELAKAQPDLNHIAAVQERGQVQLLARGRALRRGMLAFYNALSPRQKTALRDFLRVRFERMQSSWQGVAQLAKGTRTAYRQGQEGKDFLLAFIFRRSVDNHLANADRPYQAAS